MRKKIIKLFKRLHWNFYLKGKLWVNIQAVTAIYLRAIEESPVDLTKVNYWKTRLTELTNLWKQYEEEIK